MSDMASIKDKIYKYGVVPVVIVEKEEQAAPLANALVKGELEIAEVTFRTDCAAAAIAAMLKAQPDMLVGAGTVLAQDQIDAAMKAGAQFIVTPGLDENLVKYCQEKNILIIPGCSTASDVQKAASLGLDTVKFFPAEANGGIKTVQALAAVYKNMNFLPTGGITPDKFSPYLRDPAVIAVGTSWIAPKKLMDSNDFAAIAKRARDAMFAVNNFAFCHMGINCDTQKEGYSNIFKLAEMFNMPIGDTGSSSYVGREVEITKQPFKVRGPHGHFGYYTDNLDRAIFYLEKRGIPLDHANTKPFRGTGQTYVIYLKDQLAGFAIHLEERNDHNPPRWETVEEVKERIDWKD